MSTITLTTKNGKLVQVKVIETVDEIWNHVTWCKPEYGYEDNYVRNMFNKEFIRLSGINNEPVVISKRFILTIE